MKRETDRERERERERERQRERERERERERARERERERKNEREREGEGEMPLSSPRYAHFLLKGVPPLGHGAQFSFAKSSAAGSRARGRMPFSSMRRADLAWKWHS